MHAVDASVAAHQTPDSRTARELAYQLHAGDQIDRLAESLSTIPFLLALYICETVCEVLAYLAPLIDDIDVERC